MTRVTQISKEDMEPSVAARTKAMEAAQAAEKALKDARLAELEFKVQIQQLYLVKGLNADCKVDISNGTVAWPEEKFIEETPVEVKKTSKRGKRQPVLVPSIEEQDQSDGPEPEVER